MDITITKNEKELTVAVAGRLDTLTSPELEAQLEKNLGDSEKLIFDFKDLKFISSAGLRVLLTSMQAMDGKGEMVLRNVSRSVMDIFEVTGFAEDLVFE